MMHLVTDQKAFTRIKYLYKLEPGKYTLKIQNYSEWDNLIKELMLGSFFRWEWVLSLNEKNVDLLAKLFDIKLDEYYETIFQQDRNSKPRITKGKMWANDRRNQLYQNLKKSIIYFTSDNRGFIKEKI